MKKHITNCSAVVLLLCVVLGCSRIGLISGGNSFFESGEAQKAAMAIREKIGKPFNVAEVYIEDKTFRVHAQNPDNPKNLDEYTYVAGFISGPTPVKLNAMNENLEKSTFPFDEIDFAAIPEFVREAIEKSGIEGANIYRMTFQRGLGFTESGMGSLGSAYWNIEIHGTRENVSATADPKGKLLGVDLSNTTQSQDFRLLSREELQKAQDELEKLLGPNARFSKVWLDDKFLSLRIPNPENPGVLDNYMYGINGLSKKNEPMKMPNIKMPGKEDVSLSDINLADAVNFVEKAKKRVDMPDAAVSSVTISSESGFNGKGFRTTWSVILKKGVSEGSVDYSNDGKELYVRKNGETIFREK